jgi:hypothetical protein
MASLSNALREELVSAARTAIGDDLRSVTYFTADGFEQVYLRADLEQDADVSRFVEVERHGFHSQEAYGTSELGTYRYTIRAFDHGYVTRVVVGGEGVFVTTDELKMDRFDEVAVTLAAVLAGE